MDEPTQGGGGSYSIGAVLPMQQQPPIQPLASVPCDRVCKALAEAQGKFLPIRRTDTASIKGTTQGGKDYEYKYKYAPLDKVLDATRPALAECGLAVSSSITVIDGAPYVRTMLWHGEQWLACDYPVYRTRSDHQGFASGTTYARRYGYCLLLCVAPEDDDDGHAAGDGGGPPDDWRGEMSEAHRKKLPPNKPLPAPKKKVEPAHDPETGELREPHELPVLMDAEKGADWVDWGGTFVGTLKAATSSETMERWVHENNKLLVRCMQEAKPAHDRIMKRLGELRDKWKQPATEKAQ